MKKIIAFIVISLLLCGCASDKKSSLGAQISRSPKIQSITEAELESLADTEENYFILFCAGKDVTCQAIVEDTQKLKLSQPAAYYFFDLEDSITARSTQDAKAAEQAIQDFLAFLDRYAITKIPTIHYYKGAKFIKSHNIEEYENSAVLTEAEEQARIEEFRNWMNSVE